MATFDEELQIILDRHPEIDEVRVKYKKAGTVFKPRGPIPVFTPQQKKEDFEVKFPEMAKVAEMIHSGELA